MRWKPVLATASCIAALVVVVQSPVAAFADSTVVLPLTGYSDMAIDQPHGSDPGHIIVSGFSYLYGGNATGVVETGIDGSNPVTVGSMSGAQGLAMSPDYSRVYVTQYLSNQISSFDPTAPQTVTNFSTGANTCPRDVAVAGDGNVWFSYGCTTASEDLGVLDPTTQTVTLGLASALFGRVVGPPILLTNSPAKPNSIVVSAPSTESYPAKGTLAVLSVSGTTASIAAQTAIDYPVDVEVAPDAASVFVTVGVNQGGTAFRYSMTDLSSQGTYVDPNNDIYSDGVAESADGKYVAVGGSLPATYTTFGPDSAVAVHTYQPNLNANAEGRGSMGWIGSTLVAVMTDAETRVPRLVFFSSPEAAATTMTLTGPSTSVPGQPLVLHGTLTSRGAPVVGAQVGVSRTVGGVTTTLTPVTTDSSGNFTVSDAPTVDGSTSYAATSVADTTHVSATASATVNVARLASTLTLSGPSSATRTKALTLTGSLSSGGSPLAGATLTVTKTSIEGSAALASVVTGSNGSFSIPNTPYVGGPNTYSVSFAGDSTHAPAAASFTVAVSRVATSFTLTTDLTTYKYKTQVHVTAHLGTTNGNRTVTLYVTQYGHAKATLKSGTVDSHGNLSTYFYGTVNTTVAASFSGDAVYAPASASKKIYVDGSLSTKLSGYYGTSGNYYLIHVADAGVLTATLAPNVNVPGRHVWFALQVDKSGSWESAAPSVSIQTSGGTAVAGFHCAIDQQCRIEVIYYGDAGNSGVTSPWTYVEFR